MRMWSRHSRRTLPSSRSQIAFARGALIGVFAWPVLLLAVWRLVQIANSDERLRPEYQRKANLGAMIVAIPLLLFLLSCCLFPLFGFGRWREF